MGEADSMNSVKIKLNNGSASGMYILLEDDEIKYTKTNETKPPRRAYKIQIEIEVIYNHKRCRGKRTFNIRKGTSLVTAVDSLLGKRNEMRNTLREKGTLKVESKAITKVDTSNRVFKDIYDLWIQNKKIEGKASNTLILYDSCYKNHLKSLYTKKIDDITVDMIQNIINGMINKKLSAGTMKVIRALLKPLLELYDVDLNWKKISFPEVNSDRTFKKSDAEAKLIADVLLTYPHPILRGVFSFLLTGRRVGEILLLEYEDIDFSNNTFTLRKEITKTNTEVTYQLTSVLIDAVKSQKIVKGKIFDTCHGNVRYHFNKAMRSINIYSMTPHDLRSMVAVVSLRNGANVYDVSKMLSHKKISTTESRYLSDGVETATNAQQVFNKLISTPTEIIDTELLSKEFSTLKELYPNATDEKIYEIIEIISKLQ